MPERATPRNPIWTRHFGIFPTSALSYLIRRYRYASKYVCGKRTLDMPCGNGMGGPFLRKSSYLVGSDISEEALSFCASNYTSAYSNLVKANMEETPFLDGEFEVIVCLEGIEHISRPAGIRFLNEAWRILQPHGTLVLSCPVVDEGRHTTNEFHVYEWQKEELHDIVSHLFKIENESCLDGPEGTVLLLVASRLEKPQSYVDSRLPCAANKMTSWLAARSTQRGYSYAEGNHASLLASCLGLLLQSLWQGEEESHSLEVAQVADYIKHFQDAEFGYFGRECIVTSGIHESSENGQLLLAFLTNLSICSLSQLRATKIYKLQFLESFFCASYLSGWLEGDTQGDNELINRVVCHLQSLACSALQENRVPAAFFEMPIRALWQKWETKFLNSMTENPEQRLCLIRSYHCLLPLSIYCGIMPTHPREMIDIILMDHNSSLLCGDFRCTALRDFRAVDTLCKLSLLLDYRLEEIKSYFSLSLDRIFQLQREDGGFSSSTKPRPRGKSIQRKVGEFFFLDKLLGLPYREQPQIISFSGLANTHVNAGSSDMLGTWLRSCTIMLIHDRFPEILGSSNFGHFPTLPTLGWHDREKILSLIPSHD